MDSQLTSRALHSRINNNISQLLQRFENIIAPTRFDHVDHTQTAVEAYNLNVETGALIRAAEDILSLTRSMKEAWLFEKLDTLGENDRDRQRNKELEENVQKVKGMVMKELSEGSKESS
ncbi:hypothetical protein VTN49DRAFT_5741 [Thermomyces lanuginosus]|uniref:uncharacterized protein n=1 Tax=Thermomyces lanuginosus TaxID=5541 RepID=UPI0037427F3C